MFITNLAYTLGYERRPLEKSIYMPFVFGPEFRSVVCWAVSVAF